jgi:hypothetical protein
VELRSAPIFEEGHAQGRTSRRRLGAMRLTQAKAIQALDDAFSDKLKALFGVRVTLKMQSQKPADEAEADKHFETGVRYALDVYDDAFEIIKRVVPE